MEETGMDLGIAGRLALVTGGSKGIGKGVALKLAEEGCHVILLARDAAVVEAVAAEFRAKGLKAHGYSADITDKTQVLAVLAKIRAEHGDPEILIYNNGGAADSYFEQATDEEYIQANQLLILGFAWCVQALLPSMKQKRWGRILTLGSICAKEPHRDYHGILHNLGRPAQIGMSKTLANQYGEFGITFNVIATGTIANDGTSVQRSWAQNQAAGVTEEEVLARRLRNVPLKRLGTLEEYSAVCAFLCSEPAAYVTGQTIVVDGGRVNSLM
jgi:3-oxoacyl-[acyl-carrier protein] reductase